MMSESGIHFTYPAALAASRNPFGESGLHAATFVIDAITIILHFFPFCHLQNYHSGMPLNTTFFFFLLQSFCSISSVQS